MGLYERIIDAASGVASALASVGRTAPAQLREEIATPNPWHDRDAAMLGNQLTPKRLTEILWRRNQGELQLWNDLADEHREKNPHLHSQLALRELSVVETKFEIVAGLGSNQRGAIRAADAAKELLQAWENRERSNAFRWLAEFVSAHYYTSGLHEVLWERTGGETVPTELSWVDPRRLSYACDQGAQDPWELRLWDQFGGGPFDQWNGVPVSKFHRDKFLIHQPRVRGSQPTREGLFAIIVWWTLFYVWDWRDLMAAIEMLGRPPVVAYYSAGGAKADGTASKFNGERNATKEEVAAAKRAVDAVSGSLRAVLADTTRLEALELPLSGSDPIQLRASQAIERLISKAINGVDSVSDMKPGARAAVEVQERTSLTFWRADCRYAASALQRLIARYIRANPGRFGDCPLPQVRAQTDEPDYLAMLTRVEKARANGMKVPEKWAHEQCGIPQPAVRKDGTTEPVLSAPVVVSPAENQPRKGPPVTTPEAQ